MNNSSSKTSKLTTMVDMSMAGPSPAPCNLTKSGTKTCLSCWDQTRKTSKQRLASLSWVRMSKNCEHAASNRSFSILISLTATNRLNARKIKWHKQLCSEERRMKRISLFHLWQWRHRLSSSVGTRSWPGTSARLVWYLCKSMLVPNWATKGSNYWFRNGNLRLTWPNSRSWANLLLVVIPFKHATTASFRIDHP